MKTEKILQMMDAIEKTVVHKENWWGRMRFLLERSIKTKSNVRFYCDICEESMPVEIERLSTDSMNGEKIWGDIVCNECKFVIATIEADEPGVYEFSKKEGK